jgi:hypothetical protein
MIGFRHENGKLTATPVPLIQYIDNLNRGQKQDFEFTIQKNDVLEYEGQLWFVSGLSIPIDIRPLYQMAAIGETNLGLSKIDEIKKINIDQLGAIKNTN